MQRLREALGLSVYVDNDANVAALAESAFGASRDVKSSILVTLGTGVGGGIVENRRVRTGAHGVGGEIGHMVVVMDGEKCNCGHRGCWEKYASATAIIRMGRALMEEKPDCALARQLGGDAAQLNAKAVLDLAKAGDADCMGIFETYVKYLCVGLANLINIYDPDMIVLGGGVAYAGDFLLDAVRAALGRLCVLPGALLGAGGAGPHGQRRGHHRRGHAGEGGMMRQGFDNDMYIRLQSERIRERIAQFGGKLYLEFGGKLFDDNHASRVLPAFSPTANCACSRHWPTAPRW